MSILRVKAPVSFLYQVSATGELVSQPLLSHLKYGEFPDAMKALVPVS